MKVVIDTNVLISGMINVNGMPAQILNLLVNGRITVLYDSRILKEYEEVLGRKKFGFRKASITPLLDYIKNEGEYVTAEPSPRPFTDADDRAFYEVARTARANCLVTGNKDHYPKEKLITSPKEFIDYYLSENDPRKPGAT